MKERLFLLILALAFAASCAVSEASIGSDEQKEKRSLRANGEWVLAISRDDASLLGVPDSLYSNFVEYVSRLNMNK